MNKLIALFTILVTLLSACSPSENIPKLKPLKMNDKVLAFGDSLTVGKGAKTVDGYPNQLAKLIKRPVVSVGISGETTAAGLKRFAGELRRARPALVIILQGGNDTIRRIPAQETYNNLRQMIMIAKKQKTEVLLVGVPSFSLMLSAPEPASYYEKLATDFNLPYEKEALPQLLHDNRYKSDSIHLNAKGYKKLAEAIAELMRKAGAV